MFSLKVVLETIPHPDYSPITEYVPYSDNPRTKDDINTSFNFLKDFYPFLHMEKTLTYTDADSLKKELLKHLKHFIMEPGVLLGCNKAHHQKVISIFRNGDNPLPDFALHCIAMFIIENAFQLTLKELNPNYIGNPLFRGIENTKIQERVNKYQFLKRTRQPIQNQISNTPFISTFLMVFLGGLFFELSFATLLVLAISSALTINIAIPLIFEKILNNAFSSYNTPDKIKTISKAEKEALIAGFQPKSFSTCIKHLRYLPAFLAGMKLRRFEEFGEPGISLALYQLIMQKEEIPQQDIREKCIQAALARKSKLLVPAYQEKTTGNATSLPIPEETTLREEGPRLRVE